MTDIVLAVVAHPDDEVIGLGGTLAAHAASEDDVHILILADGEGSRTSDDIDLANSIIERENSATKVGELINARSVTCLSFPDNRLDTVPRLDLAKAIENYIEGLGATIVYTHHKGDVNIDHQRAHEAVIIAARSMPGQNVHTILFFETCSSTEWQTPASNITFAPNWFVDISNFWDIKCAALNIYESEMRDFPHTRSYKAIEALAIWRGASSGKPKAEAFMLGRKII